MSGDAGRSELVYLVGFMGCGKSTVGRVLARELGCDFIDLDDRIVASAGMSIADLIEQKGEPFFRELETEELGKVSKGLKAVVALGGGAYISERNRELVEASGISVWIDSPFELCWQRIAADTVIRPLAPGREIAEARWEARRGLYALAGLTVIADPSKTAEDLAKEIISHLC